MAFWSWCFEKRGTATRQINEYHMSHVNVDQIWVKEKWVELDMDSWLRLMFVVKRFIAATVKFDI